jgi:uncharacterized protein YprB with RNaseH-like and TPR domain
MLKSTFCHVPGIGIQQEQRLWSSGVHSWEEINRIEKAGLSSQTARSITQHIDESFQRLERNDPGYFTDMLPSNQIWRVFPNFRQSIAYLDIETTGLGYGDNITTIAVYDGKSVYCYVRGQNLEDFSKDIHNYSLLVTYNGKCFDVPFIERAFNTRLNQAHIDLRYVLSNLGYKGGLKVCEKKLGLDRKELEDVDGFLAVLLWRDYQRSRNPKSLETLLAYNIQDVVNLETLLVLAYNLNLLPTPFSETHRLQEPVAPHIPFAADRETIERLNRQTSWRGGGFRRWR